MTAGGKRPGAGRKPIYGNIMLDFKLKLTQEQLNKAAEIAIEIGTTSISAGIRHAIDSYVELIKR